MKALNLTTPKLSKLSSVPVPSIKNLLYGASPNPEYKTIKPLADALRCDLDDLIGDEASNDSPRITSFAIDISEVEKKFTEEEKVQLLKETYTLVAEFLTKHQFQLSQDQRKKIVDDIWQMSLKNAATTGTLKVDKVFAELLLELHRAS